MALVSTLVPDVRVEIPEIPGFVAERQLLRAARELTEEARCWRVNITVSTTADTATIDLSAALPAGTELVDIISMKHSGGYAPVVPRTFMWLDENSADWRSETNTEATWYVLQGNNTLRLVPTPSSTVTDAYYVRVAVKPTLSATTIDDVVLNKYDELLVHGALARLYVIPRKPWTDLNLAGYYQGMFQDGIRSARTEAADEFQTGVPRKVKYGGL